MAEEKKIIAKKEKEINFRDLSICDATIQMLEKAKRDGVETAFDRAVSMKACPIGADSACCKHCSMGPCRLNAKDPYGKVGVCGATIDTIMARNFARMVASGCAAHTDHGMSMLDLFREVVNGKIHDYKIKDTVKLEEVAQSIGIETEGREMMDIAKDLYKELERTYTQVEGEIPFADRVPAKTLETWRKLGIVPRGSMREIMEIMHRTHMGVDQHYENITKQCSRTALADGWGGSMVATEISDILFGTPSPISIEVNMGVLKEDFVNVIVHGHEPNLFESMIESCNEQSLIEEAKKAGAKGINLAGMCCSGAEVLVRHGIPHAGNFMSTEAVLVTGAVDVMCVDVQCIKQGLAKVAECYGTPLITTNPRCHIEGATHIEFHEHTPKDCTDEVVIKAISRFKNRKAKVEIPQIRNIGVHGFSHEYIKYMLGGTFRASYRPLNDNIINGRIRGVAGVVGCTNPRVKQDWVHVELVKELIKNDVLVVQTGCSQVALAKAGLTTPEAAVMAGPGLREVCETVGMPPVLGIGSCVDNSRILIACAEMVKEGGLGESIADLPVAGAAPEWMSEKAISIGQYFVASGVYTVF
ncbi:MAG: anaerobic carbon-monoxide dehydrogenase catalytic subunit, partial [Desulfobacterales bacterium]